MPWRNDAAAATLVRHDDRCDLAADGRVRPVEAGAGARQAQRPSDQLDPDRHGKSYAAEHRALDDGVIAWDGLLLDGWRPGRSGDVAAQLEEILGEADALIRQRLEARGLELPHLVVAVTPDGQVVLRSNVPPEVLRSFGKDLIDVADTLAAPDGETTH